MTAAPPPPHEAYASDVFRWWHLSSLSPELRAALDSGWAGTAGDHALDIGCGLGRELEALAERGFVTAGIDLSRLALRSAHRSGTPTAFVRATAVRLPFRSETFDFVLDRGCFHYLDRPARAEYAREAERVARPGARFLLRACLTSRGEPNGIDESTVHETFSTWHVDDLERSTIPSDTRSMPALVARLRRPGRALPRGAADGSRCEG